MGAGYDRGESNLAIYINPLKGKIPIDQPSILAGKGNLGGHYAWFFIEKMQV